MRGSTAAVVLAGLPVCLPGARASTILDCKGMCWFWSRSASASSAIQSRWGKGWGRIVEESILAAAAVAVSPSLVVQSRKDDEFAFAMARFAADPGAVEWTALVTPPGCNKCWPSLLSSDGERVIIVSAESAFGSTLNTHAGEVERT